MSEQSAGARKSATLGNVLIALAVVACLMGFGAPRFMAFIPTFAAIALAVFGAIFGGTGARITAAMLALPLLALLAFVLGIGTSSSGIQRTSAVAHTYAVHVYSPMSYTGSCLVRQSDGNSVSHDISGSGDSSFSFDGDWLSCSAQKKDPGEQIISLKITDADRVVGESTATQEFGIADVSGE